MPAIAEADACHLVAVGLDRGRHHAEMDAYAGLGMTRLEIFRDFGRHRARHHAVGELEHVDRESLDPRGGGELEADETRADHDHVLAGREARPQILAIVEDAQITHIRQSGIGKIQQAIACAGGKHEMAVVERATRSKLELARVAIDRHRMIGDQFDGLIGKEFLRPEHQAVGAAGAFQIGLRQRRPLIRQMRFIIDEDDPVLVAGLAQGGRDLKAGMAGADNHNSLRHASGGYHAKRQGVKTAQRVVEPPRRLRGHLE